MPRKKKRLYKKRDRWYADFRDYADVGGGLEAMIEPGETRATKDSAVAERLSLARLDELERLRKSPRPEPGIDLTRLGDFVDFHLITEASTDRETAGLKQTAQQLECAVAFLGPDTKLRDIDTDRVSAYMFDLSERLAPESVKKYLSALSKLFRRARAKRMVPPSHNPFTDLMDRPKIRRREIPFLEVPEAALLLEAAHLYCPKRDDLGIPYLYPLVATLLLSGARPAEVFGLTVDDVNFERETLTFREHAHRRLKNAGSSRTIPLWPQLRVVLEDYLAGPDRPSGALMFPSPKNPKRPVSTISDPLAELSRRIGREVPITAKIFRHTYCAARLQTTDNGQPVAPYTVAKELGHRSQTMVDRIYGHLGNIRHGDGAYAWNIEGGTLPPGVVLTAGGALTGTPTEGGDYAFTVRVADGAHREASRNLLLTVTRAPTIQTVLLPAGDVDSPFAAQLEATGGTGAYTWTLIDGTLPGGLTLAANGAITGTPVTLGSSTFTVRVTDAAGATHARSFTIVIARIDALSSGVAVTGIGGEAGSNRYYVISVPAGASQLTFATSGGTGDVDLYVRYGSLPQEFVYDCRPFRPGNQETCTFTTPAVGLWYVMLRGHGDYAEVRLMATYNP